MLLRILGNVWVQALLLLTALGGPQGILLLYQWYNLPAVVEPAPPPKSSLPSRAPKPRTKDEPDDFFSGVWELLKQNGAKNDAICADQYDENRPQWCRP